MSDLTAADIGKWFKVPDSPNPHKMVRFEPLHCSLHGEFCWNQVGLIKRRNSDKKPWGGCIKMFRADQNKIEPWDGPIPSEPTP